MPWSEWKKFNGTVIEFDMYCFSNNTNDFGNSRFCSMLDNAKVTIAPTHNNTSYLYDELDVRTDSYNACGTYYRIDNTSNYVRVKEEIILESVNYIDILVLGYGNMSSTSRAEAHIKIE